MGWIPWKQDASLVFRCLVNALFTQTRWCLSHFTVYYSICYIFGFPSCDLIAQRFCQRLALPSAEFKFLCCFSNSTGIQRYERFIYKRNIHSSTCLASLQLEIACFLSKSCLMNKCACSLELSLTKIFTGQTQASVSYFNKDPLGNSLSPCGIIP